MMEMVPTEYYRMAQYYINNDQKSFQKKHSSISYQFINYYCVSVHHHHHCNNNNNYNYYYYYYNCC